MGSLLPRPPDVSPYDRSYGHVGWLMGLKIAQLGGLRLQNISGLPRPGPGYISASIEWGTYLVKPHGVVVKNMVPFLDP